MNTTDLLLQMTLAATQIAQNTTPPVSGRTEDAGDRRDFSTLLAEKRVEAAGTETGRAVPESQKGEVPAAADGGALSQQPSFKRELIYLLTEPREIFRYSDIFL